MILPKTESYIDMKTIFYFSLIVLAMTVPDACGALWFAILAGTIIGLLKYNLSNVKSHENRH